VAGGTVFPGHVVGDLRLERQQQLQQDMHTPAASRTMGTRTMGRRTPHPTFTKSSSSRLTPEFFFSTLFTTEFIVSSASSR
jgi:hypothetical protein